MEFTPEEVYNEQHESWLRQHASLIATRVGASILAFSAVLGGMELTAEEGQAAEVACATSGDMCSWGGNGAYERGNSDDPYNISRIPGDVNLTSATDVADSSYNSAVAVRSDGTVWQWGSTTSGSDATPEKVTGIANAISVTAGSSRYALLADGHVVAWGNNNYGQLGNNSTANSTAPVEVQGLKDITSVVSGANTVYALDKDGSVWTWGNGREGRLGTGKAENAVQHNDLIPSKIAGLASIKDISASANNGFALRADGTVMAWGASYNNLLGTDTNQNAIIPQAIPGLKSIKSLGYNTPSSTEFAVDSAGKAWAWGSGRAGALGDNNCDLGTRNSAPVHIWSKQCYIYHWKRAFGVRSNVFRRSVRLGL
ncbi:MAG TPA: hypothetical protein VJ843_01640 [Candidatus Saccharimonadales bacterium]|nr:hypothetical protein [Candidatus Saccharimonadales bacterium]